MKSTSEGLITEFKFSFSIMYPTFFINMFAIAAWQNVVLLWITSTWKTLQWVSTSTFHSARIFAKTGNCSYHVSYDVGQSLTYDGAKNICRSVGGSLAMIKSLEIQDFIEEQMVKQYGVHGFKESWFGGYKRNGVWYWEDGTKISFNRKWGNQDRYRTALTSWRSKLLNDTLWFSKMTTENFRGYICEKPGKKTFNSHFSLSMLLLSNEISLVFFLVVLYSRKHLRKLLSQQWNLHLGWLPSEVPMPWTVSWRKMSIW